MRLTLAGLGAALAWLAPSPAQAALKNQTFSTPGQHVFVVPPAVHSLLVAVVGGNGGAGSSVIAGGAGATVTAALAVHPGQKLFAEVGGNGQPGVNTITGGLGGYNGGGAGGSQVVLFAGAPSGGGGGGASDIRTIPNCPAGNLNCGSLGSRLVVAGGGGGGGGSSADASGGIGGASDADGFAGNMDNHGDAPGTGGLRGTLSGGGAAGTPPQGPPGNPGNPLPGVLGRGGEGSLGSGGAGGGGGGGIYGGGGGGAGAAQLLGSPPNETFVSAGGGGGAGGASSQPPGPPGVTDLSLRPTASGAQPTVKFFWKLPRPTVLTLPPTARTATSATLRGKLNPNAALVTNCQFTISPATPLGSTIPCAQQLHVGILPVPVSARVAGLKRGTKYTVRLVGVNAQGIARAAPITFRTRRRRR
jgi:hypothetical protein